jgi:methylated-DNA-[protein]-cysteine S-methyltransferase
MAPDSTPELFFTTFKTSYGWVGLVGSTAGLRGVALPQPSEKAAIASLSGDVTQAMPSSARFTDLIKRLQAYFSGNKVNFSDTIDYHGYTPFQCAVWEAARQIPQGQTRSYGWLAGQMGKPKAARAVGQALGKNPFPIIVPCHRVLAGDGGLGGFTGGLNMKKSLLALEKTALVK